MSSKYNQCFNHQRKRHQKLTNIFKIARNGATTGIIHAKRSRHNRSIKTYFISQEQYQTSDEDDEEYQFTKKIPQCSHTNSTKIDTNKLHQLNVKMRQQRFLNAINGDM